MKISHRHTWVCATMMIHFMQFHSRLVHIWCIIIRICLSRQELKKFRQPLISGQRQQRRSVHFLPPKTRFMALVYSIATMVRISLLFSVLEQITWLLEMKRTVSRQIFLTIRHSQMPWSGWRICMTMDITHRRPISTLWWQQVRLVLWQTVDGLRAHLMHQV